jgi:hypothetical protein
MFPITTSRRDQPDINRRTVIAAAFAALGTACLSRSRWWKNDEADLSAFAKRLVRVLGLTGHPTPTGVAHTDILDDSQLSALVERLLGESQVRFASMSDVELRNRMHRNIVADYENGRMQSVQGWLLSTTERDALNLASYLHRSTLRS